MDMKQYKAKHGTDFDEADRAIETWASPLSA